MSVKTIVSLPTIMTVIGIAACALAVAISFTRKHYVQPDYPLQPPAGWAIVESNKGHPDGPKFKYRMSDGDLSWSVYESTEIATRVTWVMFEQMRFDETLNKLKKRRAQLVANPALSK